MRLSRSRCKAAVNSPAWRSRTWRAVSAESATCPGRSRVRLNGQSCTTSRFFTARRSPGLSRWSPMRMSLTVPRAASSQPSPEWNSTAASGAISGLFRTMSLSAPRPILTRLPRTSWTWRVLSMMLLYQTRMGRLPPSLLPPSLALRACWLAALGTEDHLDDALLAPLLVQARLEQLADVLVVDLRALALQRHGDLPLRPRILLV